MVLIAQIAPKHKPNLVSSASDLHGSSMTFMVNILFFSLCVNC